MGKSNAKPVKKCSYILPHPQHVWTNNPTDKEEKFFCKGIEAPAHKHVWESDQDIPVMRGEDGKPYILFSPYDENPLWEGPLSCSCGKSLWLKEGRYKPKEIARFPHADALERIMTLKEKIDAGGPDALDEADKAELQAIAEDIIRILQPLMEQLQKMGEMIVKMIQSFLDSLPPETVAYLAELGKSIGEKPDHIDTIELRGSDGHLISTEVLTPSPISAVPATAIVSDDEQQYVSEPTTGPVPITTAIPSNVVHIEPGQAIVGGRVIDLASLPVPRAQSFRSSSEY